MFIKSTMLAGLVVVLTLGAGAPAGAQWQPRDRDQRGWDRDDRPDLRRQAYNNGYRRGTERGEQDARRGRRANLRDEREYRNGDWGYDSRFGDREMYRDVFREGFEAGYSSGYGRYAPGWSGRAVPRGAYEPPPVRGGYYGDRGYGYYNNDVGFRNGYRDGLEKGEKDGRNRKSYDVLRHDWYRDGDHHYEHEYGPRRQYQLAYREGFKRGYDAGYRGRW